LKYLSFMVSGNFTPEISNFVLVAITKFWLMRRKGQALILKGPEIYKEQYWKQVTANMDRHRNFYIYYGWWPCTMKTDCIFIIIYY
jgi:hypothetical protein